MLYAAKEAAKRTKDEEVEPAAGSVGERTTTPHREISVEGEPVAGSVGERTTTPHGEISVEGEPAAGSVGERTTTTHGEISEEEVEEEGVCVVVKIG